MPEHLLDVARVQAALEDRQPDALVAKAWTDARDETIRSLRSRAKEHDRIAAMGGQSSGQMQRRLAEMGHPTYAQQAIAERALADQVESLRR